MSSHAGRERQMVSFLLDIHLISNHPPWLLKRLLGRQPLLVAMCASSLVQLRIQTICRTSPTSDASDWVHTPRMPKEKVGIRRFRASLRYMGLLRKQKVTANPEFNLPQREYGPVLLNWQQEGRLNLTKGRSRFPCRKWCRNLQFPLPCSSGSKQSATRLALLLT